MGAIIINPGTEGRTGAAEDNAKAIADRILYALGEITAPVSHRRESDADGDGWFRFVFHHGSKAVEVDIPGDDPDEVISSVPFKSRRLYVDGSSWLYGFAVGCVAERLGIDA